jgi:hypothetical protein
MVTIYKVAIMYKRGGDSINIYSYTNYLNIKAIRKVFKGEVIIK